MPLSPVSAAQMGERDSGTSTGEQGGVVKHDIPQVGNISTINTAGQQMAWKSPQTLIAGGWSQFDPDTGAHIPGVKQFGSLYSFGNSSVPSAKVPKMGDWS